MRFPKLREYAVHEERVNGMPWTVCVGGPWRRGEHKAGLEQSVEAAW